MRHGRRSRSLAAVFVLAVAVASCESNDDADISATSSEADMAGERVYDPALRGEDRAALVSEWAEGEDLLTREEVVAALGESTAVVVDAESPEIASEDDPWGAGFSSPFPDDEFAADAGVTYVVRREGDGRDVFMYVSEYVARGPTVDETYVTMKEAESLRNTPAELYDPVPIGVEAFAFETGSSGARDRLVVVELGDALVVISANPASVAPGPDPTESEDLTREQVDDLVEAAVAKLG